MKNIFKTLAVAAMALFAVSCVTEATSEVKLAEESVVTFSVHSSGLGSRAASDINSGYKATQLTYAIYDDSWKHLQTYTDTFDGVSLEKEIKLRLVKNKTYNFVFWAQSEAAKSAGCYELDLDTEGAKPSVTVDYSKLAANPSNNDHLDAFFGQELNLTVDGTVRKTIELRRPFAQINFGADDLQAAKDMGFDLANATVSFTTKTYRKFFLHDGNVDDTITDPIIDVTFTDAPTIDTPTDLKNLKTTLGDFHWVSMNYILCPKANELATVADDWALPVCEITVKIPGEEDVKIEAPQAPARRNWRTNLVGSLLTEDATFMVEIKPIPNTDSDHDIQLPVPQP